MKSLFIAVDERGEPLDTNGAGGFTVWRSRREAEGAIGEAIDKGAELPFAIVEFRRVER